MIVIVLQLIDLLSLSCFSQQQQRWKNGFKTQSIWSDYGFFCIDKVDPFGMENLLLMYSCVYGWHVIMRAETEREKERANETWMFNIKSSIINWLKPEKDFYFHWKLKMNYY